MKARLIVIFCCSTLLGWSQPKDSTSSSQGSDSLFQYVSKTSKQVMQAIIVEGDTIPFMALDEVLLVDNPTFTNEEARRRYYILRRKVIKVYPYAVIAGNKLDSLNIQMKGVKSKRKKKKLAKNLQEYLEGNFKDELVNLTHSEGQILSKLVYRETGITSYDLISEYRSDWNAFWWNVAANWNKISLKTPYEPKSVEEDKLIEAILQRAFVKGLLKEREPFKEFKKPTPAKQEDED